MGNHDDFVVISRGFIGDFSWDEPWFPMETWGFMEEQAMNTGDIWGFNVNPSERLQFYHVTTPIMTLNQRRNRCQVWDSVPKRRGSPATRPLSQYASYGPDAISNKKLHQKLDAWFQVGLFGKSTSNPCFGCFFRQIVVFPINVPINQFWQGNNGTHLAVENWKTYPMVKSYTF